MSEIPIFKFAIRKDLNGNKLFLPTRGEPQATGWDVRAAFPDQRPMIIEPFEYVKIPLGFRAFCPAGWWLQLKPRSSSFAKKNLHALYGVIDEGYENEMVFACQYLPYTAGSLQIEFGEAIGQLIPVRRQEMAVEEASNEEYDTLCKTRGAQRGTGGFGSTDRK